MPGTTNFPAALDAFPEIDANTQEDGGGVEHDVVHANEMAAIAALQAKVGVDGSADPASLDRRLALVEANKLDSSQVGVSVASLVSGQVPAVQLPSYVDDVLEYNDVASLPATGESGKIYVVLDSLTQYRWSGTAYTQLVASPGSTDAVPEGTVNKYFTDERAQDAAAAMLAGGTHSGIEFSYDDASNTVSATVTAAGGVSSNALARSIFNKIVAWWERDEASGTVMVDAHTNGLHGTYSGITVNQPGLAANLGKSVTFPSGNNYAEVPHDAQLCPQGSFACMVWVKRNGTQGNFPKLMWKPNNSKASGNASYLLTQDNFSNGGKAAFRVTIGATNYDALTSSALADATTYMLVGNKVNAEIAIWRNGVKEGTNTNTGLANGVPHTTDALRFGYHGSSGDPWVGSQDQAAVFNDYLTPAEIAYLYNDGAGRSHAALKAAAGY